MNKVVNASCTRMSQLWKIIGRDKEQREVNMLTWM